jgi:hypothetical protein
MNLILELQTHLFFSASDFCLLPPLVRSNPPRLEDRSSSGMAENDFESLLMQIHAIQFFENLRSLRFGFWGILVFGNVFWMNL